MEFFVGLDVSLDETHFCVVDEGGLQPLGQSDEALAAEDDMGMLKPRPRQAEVVKQVIERLSRDRHAERTHVGEVRQAEPPGFVDLPEDHLPIFSMPRSPGPDPALQRPANARRQIGVTALHLLKNRNGPEPGGRLQQRHDFRIEDVLQRIRPPAFPGPILLRGKARVLNDPISRRAAQTGLRGSGFNRVVLSQLHGNGPIVTAF